MQSFSVGLGVGMTGNVIVVLVVDVVVVVDIVVLVEVVVVPEQPAGGGPCGGHGKMEYDGSLVGGSYSQGGS
jgi:hypothetical protein